MRFKYHLKLKVFFEVGRIIRVEELGKGKCCKAWQLTLGLIDIAEEMAVPRCICYYLPTDILRLRDKVRPN